MSDTAASPLPKQVQQVTDAFFNLQRIARDRDGALALCRSCPAIIKKAPRSSPSASPRSSLPASTSSPAPLLLPYLRHLQTQRWASLASSTLSHAFLSYHAAAVLAIIRMRQIEHLASPVPSTASASTSTSPAPLHAALLRSISQLQAEWASLEALRLSLLYYGCFGQQLQLSLIPRSLFPSVLQLQAEYQTADIIHTGAPVSSSVLSSASPFSTLSSAPVAASTSDGLSGVIATSRQSAQTLATVSCESEFLLRFHAGIHRQLSSLTAAFLSADHRLVSSRLSVVCSLLSLTSPASSSSSPVSASTPRLTTLAAVSAPVAGCAAVSRL